MYYQKRLAYQINEQMTQTLALLTHALHYHLNTGQNFTMNTASIVMSVGRSSLGSLLNQYVQHDVSGYIHLPAHMYPNLTMDTAVSFRVCSHSPVYFIGISFFFLSFSDLVNNTTAGMCRSTPTSRSYKSVSIDVFDSV
jgi:hypothetical protein